VPAGSVSIWVRDNLSVRVLRDNPYSILLDGPAAAKPRHYEQKDGLQTLTIPA
jgi:hypothetical protein